MVKDIFLSYSWVDELIANSIDSQFSYYGITLLRDVRDLQYKQSISEFMKKVRSTDNIILIISNNYLKSKNCMYEVLEFLKDDNYNKRILPFIHKDVNIFTAEGKLIYLNYWNDKYLALKEKISHVDSTESIPLIIELKQYEKIKKEIVEFLTVLSDMNSIIYDVEINTDMVKKVLGYLGVVSYETNDIILEIQKDKNIDLSSFEINLHSIPLLVSSIQILDHSNENATYQLKVEKNTSLKKIKSVISKFSALYNIKIIELFFLTDAYLILSKIKTLTYNSQTIIWWAPHSKGYTEEVNKAGLYSKKQVVDYIFRPKNFEDNSVVGIPKLGFDSEINLPVVPYSDRYIIALDKLKNSVIGNLEWNKNRFIMGNGQPLYNNQEDDV